ncbi:MAG: tRNA pseudouridine(55) synthase TruB [Desulfuromonadaceae bacterium]|nr:tRNA pseudouridine(55) synthase TruB [Desulfuromonadaceae bacterium]
MINGFLIIDKPAGITSHDVVSRVRRILGTRKVGHTGTLDPFATGVLPVAVNEGTKAIPFLDEAEKCYEALMRLGVATDTLDMTGKVLCVRDYSSVTRPELESAISQFIGSSSQVPPMYSAIKQSGQPLYKLARMGLEVVRAPRLIEIKSIDLLCFSPPLVSFRVVCSRGTYVRTLADDIGNMLGCGAALKELRRTASGFFDLKGAVTLEALQEAECGEQLAELCLSPYIALSHLEDIQLTEEGVAKVSHGRSPDWSETSLNASPAIVSDTLVRLSWKHELIAVAELRQNDNAAADIVLKRVFN